MPRALEAILSVLPLDYFVASPAGHSVCALASQRGVLLTAGAVAPTAGAMPPAGVEVITESSRVIGEANPGVRVHEIERFAFYEVHAAPAARHPTLRGHRSRRAHPRRRRERALWCCSASASGALTATSCSPRA